MADALDEWLTAVGAHDGSVRRFLTWAPPGHFYSPVPSGSDVARARYETALPGIDLRTADQLDLLATIGRTCEGMQPPATRSDGWRYWSDNPMFGSQDALVLHGMLRLHRPRRVVEVGSGWSSAVMLDTAERFLELRPHLTFVEPYPDNLDMLLTDDDRRDVDVLPVAVQDADPGIFAALGRDDVLFIDSSHVVKVGSDVTYLLLEVLPALAPGVVVHVHDIAYPFEVHPGWLDEGRMWAEPYLLRALLTDTDRWAIRLWNHYLTVRHPEAVHAHLPGGAPYHGLSIWLQRTG
jgi:hypothetical protein